MIIVETILVYDVYSKRINSYAYYDSCWILKTFSMIYAKGH